MKKSVKIRLFYAGGALLLIALGLASRRFGFFPAAFGDALWAMVVYCCWRIVLTEKPLFISAAAALITSFAVEFSQLLTFEWLVRFRSTVIGHLLLGKGFLWTDLPAYAAGVAAVYLLTLGIRKLMQKRRKGPDDESG